MSVPPNIFFNNEEVASILNQVSNISHMVSNMHILSFLAPLEKMGDPCELFKKLFQSEQFKQLCLSIKGQTSHEILTRYIRGVITHQCDSFFGDVLTKILNDKNMDGILTDNKFSVDLRFKRYIGKFALLVLKNELFNGTSFNEAPKEVQMGYIKLVVNTVSDVLDKDKVKEVKTGVEVYNLIINSVAEGVTNVTELLLDWIKLQNFSDDESVYKYYIDTVKQLTNSLEYKSENSKPRSNKRPRSPDGGDDRDNKKPRT